MRKSSIVLGGGCFWCLDALYRRIRGITEVVSGYAGGTLENPSYWDLHSPGNTHAEVVKVTFDSEVISLKTVLDIFWTMHDPTTPNQQGNDIGVEYRSIILYQENQLPIIEKSIKTTAEGVWGKRVTTEIKPLETFYSAEEEHQDYFNKHPERAYCQIIINPKVMKLKRKFHELLHNE